jgi:hypothetical protein
MLDFFSCIVPVYSVPVLTIVTELHYFCAALAQRVYKFSGSNGPIKTVFTLFLLFSMFSSPVPVFILFIFLSLCGMF